MPAYDYKCPKCEHVWEIVTQTEQRDTINLECPECHIRLIRKISLPMAVNWAGKFHDRWAQKSNYDGLGEQW